MWEWYLQKAEYCEVCQKAKLNTDCPKCENKCPNLFFENKRIWGIWKNIQTQWRVIDGGVIGLDYTAINFVIELLDVDLNPADFAKLRLLERMTIDNSRKEK
ncbi:DUF1799 domain-containing protein [Pelosinus sp. UFO1]|uniref:DUF1799 domain-containing protein n=1 Tax=Pelosinus sp. UFO1 TaxID=484770 RepID=UPI000A04A20A